MLLSKADYEQRTILYLLVGLFLYWVWDGSWWVADDTGYVRSFELLGGCHLCLLTQIFNLHINTQNIDFRFYWRDDISTRYWGTIHKRRRQNSGIFSPPSHVHFCQIPPLCGRAHFIWSHFNSVPASDTSIYSQYSQYWSVSVHNTGVTGAFPSHVTKQQTATKVSIMVQFVDVPTIG